MQLPEKNNDWKSEQLDITISYNRVLQLESLLTRNSCEQFKKDKVVCSPQVPKGNVTVEAIDNLTHLQLNCKVHFMTQQ